MNNIALILAAGSGNRFGGALPKQYQKLAGKLIVEYTIDAFEKNQYIDKVLLVINKTYEHIVHDLIAKNDYKKIKIVYGGSTRLDSTYSAISTLNDEPNVAKIIIHDAVRPLVSQRIINDCLNELNTNQAVDTIIDTDDTILILNNKNDVDYFTDRERTKRGQTPQGFQLGTLRNSFKIENSISFPDVTCECSFIKKTTPQINIKTIYGDKKNIKITTPEDAFIAESLISDGIDLDDRDYDIGKLAAKVCGKNFIVIGGYTGIGAAISKLAESFQARVYRCSTRNGVDVTSYDSIKGYFDSIEHHTAHIDCVINCSGKLIKSSLHSSTVDSISSQINTNIIGSLNVAKAAFNTLRCSSGMLINFGSSSYSRGRRECVPYSASKSAVVNLTQGLSDEWSPFNIRVNCVSPERTQTNMRIENFGVEPPESLLDPYVVALTTLKLYASDLNGVVVNVKR